MKLTSFSGRAVRSDAQISRQLLPRINRQPVRMPIGLPHAAAGNSNALRAVAKSTSHATTMAANRISAWAVVLPVIRTKPSAVAATNAPSTA